MFDLKEAIIFIGILSFIVFFIITIIRIVATIFYKYTIKKYMQLLSLIRPKESFESSGGYVPSNRNDVLFRDKDIEKQKEREAKIIEKEKQRQQDLQLKNVQRLPKVGQVASEEPNYNKKNIVGIVKPIGYWTSLIMGQRVTSLMQQADILREQNDAGYWVNMMHARDRAAGKQRGI